MSASLITIAASLSLSEFSQVTRMYQKKYVSFKSNIKYMSYEWHMCTCGRAGALPRGLILFPGVVQRLLLSWPQSIKMVTGYQVYLRHSRSPRWCSPALPPSPCFQPQLDAQCLQCQHQDILVLAREHVGFESI